MNLKRSVWMLHGVAGCSAIVLGAGAVGATMQNLMTYKKAHPEVKSVSCKLCHEGAVGKATDLNTSGKALQAFKGAGKAKTLTAKDFKTFERGDMDKDVVPNQQELDAGTDPNDPKSVPPAARAQPSRPSGTTRR